MAVDTAPLLRRNRKFAFKIETTTGTYESLAAANATTRVLNPTVDYDVEEIARDDETSLSDPASEFGARSGTASFQTWLHGSGTSGSAPAWADLLKGCGMSPTSLVYSPVSGATNTLSMGVYYAGSRFKPIIGAMGNAVFRLLRGQHCTVDWTFTGKAGTPSATSLTTPTYDTVTAPRTAATFTIGGTTYRVPEFTFDMGNSVVLREDITDATGYRAAYITDRSPRITVVPEAVDLGTKNWFTDFYAGTTSAGVLMIGTSSGNTISFSFPKLQLISVPTEQDRSGILAESLTFKPIKNADAGNDEYTITFS